MPTCMPTHVQCVLWYGLNTCCQLVHDSGRAAALLENAAICTQYSSNTVSYVHTMQSGKS